MKQYHALLAVLILSITLGYAQMKNEAFSVDLDPFVGVWEIQSNKDSIFFQLILEKGVFDDGKIKYECIFGSYLYKKDGKIIAQSQQKLPKKISSRSGSNLPSIIATNYTFDHPTKLNHDYLVLSFTDRGKNGKPSGNRSYLEVSRETLTWDLVEGEYTRPYPEGFSVPDHAFMLRKNDWGKGIPFPPYDSLYNFYERHIERLIGQEVIIFNRSQKSTPDFDRPYENTLFTKLGDKNEVRPLGNFNSYYGKHYIIHNIVAGGLGRGLILEIYKGYKEIEYPLLQLVEKETRDTLYYKIGEKIYESGIDYKHPLLVLGYFEKMKKLYIGKKLKATEDATEIDINTRDDIRIKKGDIVTCIDVTMSDFSKKDFGLPVYRLRTADSAEYTIPLYLYGSGYNKSRNYQILKK